MEDSELLQEVRLTFFVLAADCKFYDKLLSANFSDRAQLNVKFIKSKTYRVASRVLDSSVEC
jgi:hypothetical protein